MNLKQSALDRTLILLSGVLVVIAMVLALLVAPRERVMGDVQRIFYFHVSADWVGFLAFFVTLVASVCYLRTFERRWDILAASSAELGALFLTMGAVSGSLWARPVWNVWWTWNPQLTLVAFTWLLYLAYLGLRAAVEDPQRRARFSAVYGILAFASVPLTFVLNRLSALTEHPVLFGPSAENPGGGMGLTPPMLATMLVGVLAFSVIYLTLLRLRVRLERAAEAVAALREKVAMS
ncbi:MAG: cytochrome c biogenesis protein CcsA [Thermoflexales bacterium]|nr:cytochrome c biogenesis protein CcsA [Thermoflexales bacterium]